MEERIGKRIIKWKKRKIEMKEEGKGYNERVMEIIENIEEEEELVERR